MKKLFVTSIALFAIIGLIAVIGYNQNNENLSVLAEAKESKLVE
jgi:hypothetical protein